MNECESSNASKVYIKDIVYCHQPSAPPEPSVFIYYSNRAAVGLGFLPRKRERETGRQAELIWFGQINGNE